MTGVSVKSQHVRAAMTVLPNKIGLKQHEESAMRERIALADEAHSIRGVPFRGVVAAIQKFLGSDKVEEMCGQFGFGPRFDLTTRYPLRDFLKFEYAAAQAIAEITGDFDIAVAECGGGAVDLFFDSRAGQVMRGLSGRSPHRMLGSVPVGYQVLVNFGERSWDKLGDNSGVFKFKNELLGVMHSYGVFEMALVQSYGDITKYVVTVDSPVDFTFEISW